MTAAYIIKKKQQQLSAQLWIYTQSQIYTNLLIGGAIGKHIF